MIWSNFIQGIIFFSLTGSGIVGNILLFVGNVYTFVMGPEKKPIDLILIHLACANVIILCTTGTQNITTAFHFRNFLGNVGCKSVFYLGRVARGFSICTTCLLSVVQAVTISPRATTWRKLKPRTAWQVLPYLLFLLILNFLISSNLLYYITTVSSMNRSGTRQHVRYCDMLPAGQMVRWLFLTLMALRDIIFQSLMGWSSGYMAFRLCQHHKRVLYMQSYRFTKNSSPEIRAAQTVLLLMACFLFFYWIEFIFSFYLGSFSINDSVILNIKIVLSLGYASLSPFLLISRDVHLAKCWSTQ